MLLLRTPRFFSRGTFLARSYEHTKNAVRLHPLTTRSSAAVIGNTSYHTQGIYRRFLSLSSVDHPSSRCYNVAVVGTGPSGFYTAKYLLSAFDKMNKKKIKDEEEENASNNSNSITCNIDMIERLPTPYGLVRYGVAPDHPEVKNVENDFSALFQESDNDNTLNFWGNVAVGENVSVEELRELYDVVVLAYGCESDRKLGIPGEDDLSGVLSAREFVAWYNGHPYFDHIGEQVAAALNNDGGGSEDKKGYVVVIGQGNVALDCARILAKGSKGLNQTDIAKRALSIIGEDGVPMVTVVGRRGHVQGAFTIKELRELTKLEEEGHGAKFIVREDELDLGSTPSSQEELAQKGSRPKVRIDKLLREAAAKASEGNHDPSSNKEVGLRFLLSPKSFEASESNPSSVGSVVCERTKLEGDPGKQVAVGTGELETIPAQLVLVSIGYKGIPLPGLDQWFDDRRGIVVSKGGKVDDSTDSLGGLYVSGWLKRGPSGIIGTNIMDAKDTVVNIVRDLRSDSDSNNDASERLLELLNERNVPVVRWANFEKIDAEETSPERKRHENQPREKITDIQGLLDAAQVS